MSRRIYRYQFHGQLPMQEIEATLVLSIFAVEALFGEARTRLEVRHFLDIAGRACVIDASSVVGRMLNQLFTGLLLHELGRDGFAVEVVPGALSECGTAGMAA